MTSFQLLVQPLILLPGVVLLILSTATRFNPVVASLQQLSDQPASSAPVMRLRQRLILFRLAFIVLYAAAGLLVAASLVGAILNVASSDITILMVVLTCISFVLVLCALVILCREVTLITIPPKRPGPPAAAKPGDEA